MSLAHGNLVDGDGPQVFEFGLGEPPRQIAFLNLLDQVPTDTQMRGHVADGHPFGQFQRVPLEGLSIAPSRVGKGDLDLTHQPALPTFHTSDGKDDQCRSTANGQGAEPPLDLAPTDDLAGTASRTAASLGLLVDSEDHLAILIVGTGVLIASDAKGMIHKAGGHADLPVWSDLTQLQLESVCPPFPTPGALPPDNENAR